MEAAPRWLAAVGPEDPLLARQTDPRSLRALLGTDREDNVCTVSRAGSGFAEKHALPLYVQPCMTEIQLQLV